MYWASSSSGLPLERRTSASLSAEVRDPRKNPRAAFASHGAARAAASSRARKRSHRPSPVGYSDVAGPPDLFWVECLLCAALCNVK